MDPSTAAWRLASAANIGLRRVIPLAASLMAGLGIGAASAVSDMESAVLEVEVATGAKAVVVAEKRAPVTR